MILVHTALQSEAQSIVEFYKLELIQKKPKIYKNDSIVLVISGIGQNRTIEALKIVFNQYNIIKAINIGIAGCSSADINIGELFCTNQKLDNIKYINLKTVDDAQTNIENTRCLYDMEAKYFEEICLKYLDKKDMYVFKVVSDYLDDTIPSKEFAKQIIKKNIKSISQWIV